MKKAVFILCLTVCGCLALESPAQVLSPRQRFPGLFQAVQTSSVFQDNKTFVDMAPKEPPEAILKAYQEESGKPGFDLKVFTLAHFAAPDQHANPFVTQADITISQHIDTLWNVLSRPADTSTNSSLLPLKYDYIIPGGRFREIYYWDSYFTMLGLQQSHRSDIMENMVSNFADLIDRYGFIPNGTRSYYLTRSQPPFFSCMVDLLAAEKGDAVYRRFRRELLAEYRFWMQGATGLERGRAKANSVRLEGGEILNRYWDASDQPREESYREDLHSSRASRQKPAEYFRNIRAAAESGWDFSSRWFNSDKSLAGIHTIDLVAVDLNCLLYHLEQTIARADSISGDRPGVAVFKARAARRKKAILRYCWDDASGFFVDYNFRKKAVSPVRTLAASYALEFQIASAAQAKRMADVLEHQFLKPGGLVTTLSRTGQQWDAPNGWAPLEYLSADGLEKYGYHRLAAEIAGRWIKINLQVFGQTGKLVEKYNVEDTGLKAGGGEYPLQDGFGWSNGVLLNFMHRFGNDADKNTKPSF